MRITRGKGIHIKPTRGLSKQIILTLRYFEILRMAESKPVINATEERIKPEDQPWYQADLTDIEPEARELFEKYCNIPSDDVIPHIKQFVSGSSVRRTTTCIDNL
jgi:hypothetical protein